MAIYHLSVKPISRGVDQSAVGAAAYRSGGKSAVAAAAYRAGDKIVDIRNGKVFDYSRKQGIVHTEILAPSHSPHWVHDRVSLWNQVEASEVRKDAQLAREINVALPAELDLNQQVTLLRGYIEKQFVSDGMIADVVIHEPHGLSDERNIHAHIMLTTRTIGDDGFGKKNRDWNRKERLVKWRAAWQEEANRALAQNSNNARIDHRNFRNQGIDQEPTKHLGSEATALERSGTVTTLGNYNRKVAGLNAERLRHRRQVSNLLSSNDEDVLTSAQVTELAVALTHVQAYEQTHTDAARLNGKTSDWRSDPRTQDIQLLRKQVEAEIQRREDLGLQSAIANPDDLIELITHQEHTDEQPESPQQFQPGDGVTLGGRVSERLNAHSRTSGPHRTVPLRRTTRQRRGIDSGIGANQSAAHQTGQSLKTVDRLNKLGSEARKMGTRPQPAIRELERPGTNPRREEPVHSITQLPQPTGSTPTPRLRKHLNELGRVSNQLESTRERMAALANQVRDIPLEKVVEQLGLEPDKHDKHKWHAQGQIFSITGEKFYNHLDLKGGGGAIDLVMHVQRSGYRDAVNWLAGTTNTWPQTAPVRPPLQKPVVPQIEPFVPPVVDEQKWPEVRHYLIEARRLPASLVDELHQKGVVYADSRRNAVFLRANNQRQITGANLRGTIGNFKGLAKGTHRDNGWFNFSQGEGKLARVVLTESPIDAVSLAALEQQQRGSKTTYLSVDGNGAIPSLGLQRFIDQGGRVEIALDNDEAGDKIASQISDKLPQAIRVRPTSGKDWNMQLQQTRQQLEPFRSAKSLRSQNKPNHPQRPQQQVKLNPAKPIRLTTNRGEQVERDRPSPARVSSPVKAIAAILSAERVLDAIGKDTYEDENYRFRRSGKALTILAKDSGERIAKRQGDVVTGEVSAKDSIQLSQLERTLAGKMETQRQPQNQKLQRESGLER